MGEEINLNKMAPIHFILIYNFKKLKKRLTLFIKKFKIKKPSCASKKKLLFVCKIGLQIYCALFFE